MIASRATFPTAEKRQQIYNERLRPTLTEADREMFITINVETGEYAAGREYIAALEAARARFGPVAKLNTVRVGWRAAYRLDDSLAAM